MRRAGRYPVGIVHHMVRRRSDTIDPEARQIPVTIMSAMGSRRRSSEAPDGLSAGQVTPRDKVVTWHSMATAIGPSPREAA